MQDIACTTAIRLTERVPPLDDVEADLAVAVSRGEMFAVYQPQIALDSGATVGAEALCRWRHPRYGLIAPDVFIRLAERSGAIHGIGAFMLAEALATAEQWHRAGLDRGVSVNVSALQLAEASFLRTLGEHVTRRGLPAGMLTVEITESLPLDDALVIPRLRELRSLGLGISLDDYGTGHASLEQLENLPLTEVKIAGTLMRRTDGTPLESLTEIVEIAHSRGARVVGEGVETLAHLETAVAIGCDRAQGFLIGPPRARTDPDAPLHP